ncbi:MULTISPECIES: EAL domain-containing protein [Acidovorax]|uniref:EAL domain-containing protein n=1 Tax=Acidovorax facilis TaxID=12917 RepID=A0ABV8DEG0_9BURK|nr:MULTISPECIES: EAL domain-containing protein [Acidovorax]MBO1006428.1 EAL domain-containing protein [Acidovorax sp. SD340]MCO4242006.1 EAL domain-containing protein [Acidovorax facilis]
MGSFDTEDRPFEQEMALSEPDYRLLVDQVQAAVFVIQKGRFLFVNPKLLELFGYSKEEMLRGMDPMLLCVPEHRDMVREQTNARVAGVPGKAYEVECLRKNGERFSAQVWGVRIFLSAQAADLVTLHDVSAIQAATRYAQQRVQLFRNAEELARIGSAEVDLVSGTVTLSSGMHAILGVPLTETPPGTDWLLARVPPVERPYVQAISEGVSPDDVCEFQHRIVHTDGSLRTVLHRVLAEADEGGKVIRTVTLLQDITLQRAAEQKLDKLANTDEITGLPNRNALTEYLDTKMREAARGGRHIAVLSVEIDRLKLVSESLGHAAGDQLLMEVGRRLQPQVSQDDLLAHFGSGEFSLVLAREESVDEAMARGTAASLVDALSLPVAIGDNEIKVTCDIGISLYPVHGDDPEKLLQQAQAAMYRAHELGKNQICVFSSGMHSKAISRLVMESGLRRALERNEFELHFQPKLELVSGAIIGAEAFLEWKSPDGALISRSSYIRAAEETGLIVPIGEWVLRTACLQALEWQRAGHPMCRVAVNLSARQLQQPDLAQKIEKILIETGLDPRLLGLEITEGALMGESTRIARILGDLKTLGIEISLDDFGTGYSSLSYLRTLPIDVVKVDRSFVHDVTAASQDVSITRAIINMAHSLQMRVLAEGVETEGQLALLIANGCDQMQGHYFSGLLTADAMGSLLRESKALPEHLLLRRAQQRTLLLVDDEDSIVSALRRLLRRDGYHIVTANSGAQGLQRLAENSVDVIVSDQRMPGMTGVEFLRRAKELYPDTVRMVLSGYTELQSITDAINEGAIYKFLTKPWDDERLRGHVAEAFSQKGMADENRRLASAVLRANEELTAVNDRLQQLLTNQREQIHREESSLSVAREVLDHIPAAVIGVDLEGMVAFVNADAEALFGRTTALLGQDADDVLPADLRHVWRAADQSYHDVQLAGETFRVVCRSIGGENHSRGRLLVLVPGSAA